MSTYTLCCETNGYRDAPLDPLFGHDDSASSPT
jgi:hypothetical protein